LRQFVSDTLNSGYAGDYAAVFELFDCNKDGKIDSSEMSDSLQKLGFDLNDAEVLNVMLKLDPEGGGGSVDYRHFLTFANRGSDRDQWVLGADGQVIGNTLSGEMESSIRQKIRMESLAKSTGRQSIMRQFQHFDAGKKGYVNKTSLKKVAGKMKWLLTEEELSCLMSRFEAGEGKFAYGLFVSFLTLDDDAVYGLEQRMKAFVDSVVVQNVTLRECFDMFNRSGSGKITAKEICATMAKVGYPVGVEEAKELVRRLDINRDSKISFAEFSRAFGVSKSPEMENNSTVSNVKGIELWSDDFIEFNGALPVGPKGSVGEWLENVASKMEKRNFFTLVNMLSNFEKRLGLQQNETDPDCGDGEMVIQLGSKLKAKIKFVT